MRTILLLVLQFIVIVITESSSLQDQGYEYVGTGFCKTADGESFPNIYIQDVFVDITACSAYCDTLRPMGEALRGFVWWQSRDEWCACVFDAGSDVQNFTSHGTVNEDRELFRLLTDGQHRLSAIKL